MACLQDSMSTNGVNFFRQPLTWLVHVLGVFVTYEKCVKSFMPCEWLTKETNFATTYKNTSMTSKFNSLGVSGPVHGVFGPCAVGLPGGVEIKIAGKV